MARRPWLRVLLALGVLIAPATAASGSPAVHRISNVLVEGRTLRAGTSHDKIESRNHRFTLAVSGTIVTLTDALPIDFGKRRVIDQFWSRQDPDGHIRGHDKTTLRLQNNGNLVLRTEAGRALWSARTRGSHNRLRLTNSGNLVLETHRGRRLWASHTTAAGLGSGSTLPSRTTLRKQPLQGEVPHIVNKLTMQRDGNLVWRCNSRVAWQTHTTVPGSHAYVSPNGSLMVRTPNGRTIWSSHTPTHGPNVYLSMHSAALSHLTHEYWLLPLSRNVNCG